MPKEYAIIESLDDAEIASAFTYLCQRALRKDPRDVKKDVFGMNHLYQPTAADIIKVIKHYNLQFEIKILWEKVERTESERKKDRITEEEPVMPIPKFAQEIENQKKEIRNPELKNIPVDAGDHKNEGDKEPPSADIPDINF